ncbi:hypothetical protein [Hymenobacter lapidiphilus]|uniref:Uncharacterized protein n=1 Tax=Hymenobacter lapidiphilus TaxID=2608003 RepID=A0A7Y7PL16_9BACT|nr:hypothetical protein [Hymenobacter lapidiphilus]NVO29756.1 hypothetical protein [Hymenobacter lapidiphilus]
MPKRMTRNLQTICASLLLLGLLAWLMGFFMPAFIPGKSANDLYALQPEYSSGNAAEARKAYYATEEAWRTSRNSWLDFGSGVAISSLTILLFLRANRVQTWTRFRRIKTVGESAFVIWLNAGWALLFAALYWYYHYRSLRGDFRPMADTTAIPLMYGQIALFGGWLASNAVFLLALWPARLPALLFEKPEYNSWPTVLIDAVLFLPLMFTALYTIFTVIDGDHLTIPAALLFFYLMLVLRAGYMRAFNER